MPQEDSFCRRHSEHASSVQLGLMAMEVEDGTFLEMIHARLPARQFEVLVLFFTCITLLFSVLRAPLNAQS